MKIVFISNFYNHHQAPFSEAMYKLLGGDYYFISTEKIPDERIKLGYKSQNFPVFVKEIFKDDTTNKLCQQLINDAEVVIVGSPYNQFIKQRLRKGKLTFRYSERLLKHFSIIKYIGYCVRQIMYTNFRKNLYLLCASAFAAADYNKMFSFRGKCFKWGYFPAIKKYDQITDLIYSKEEHSLLWVARFLDWKHPEIPIELVKRLKNKGFHIKLRMIGNGPQMEHIIRYVNQNGLQSEIQILGSMSPEEVRTYMEKSQIFLFTSDRNEGWGAVLNEAMNSGCAVVASHAIGAVPFLINDGINGMIYRDGNIDELVEKVEYLLQQPDVRLKLGMQAYHTMFSTWNAEVAAQRFLDLIHSLQNGKEPRYVDGPCSRASILEDNWK